MLINISPLDYAIEYHSMYAFGNHMQVVNAKWHCFIQDLGVTTMFEPFGGSNAIVKHDENGFILVNF
jgi:hypothetical protein